LRRGDVGNFWLKSSGREPFAHESRFTQSGVMRFVACLDAQRVHALPSVARLTCLDYARVFHDVDFSRMPLCARQLALKSLHSMSKVFRFSHPMRKLRKFGLAQR